MNGNGAPSNEAFNLYVVGGEMVERTFTRGGSTLMSWPGENSDPVTVLASLDPEFLPRLWAPTPESLESGSWVIIDRPVLDAAGITTETG